MPMTTYIGTATSRVDGRAKVTGAAKYAGEFNEPGLAHASVVTSTIAKGRIARIEAGEALAVEGVIDVLTHQNRPHMASEDSAYKDDVAPEGSPFRPLYDDRIRFSFQPIALVVAEEPEIARFAASLVRVEYEQEEHVTDLHRQRDSAFAVEAPANPAENPFAPPKPRGNAGQALAAAAVRHSGEYYVPIEHHNPMELYASTVIYERWRQADGLRQDPGRAERSALSAPRAGHGAGRCARRFAICGRRVRLRAAPAIPGGSGGAGGARAEALGAPRADPAADVWARLSAGHDPADRAGCERRRNTRCDHPRSDHGDLAIRGFPPPGNRLVRPALQDPTTRNTRTSWRGSILRRHATCARPSAAPAVYALECAMDELAVALKLDPLELRLRCYSDRDQHGDRPYSSKSLRECYHQGAEAFGWASRSAEPRSMRDGTELVGWGMATGVWEALQVPIAVRIVLTANGHAEVACATSDIGTGTYTIMAQVAAEMLGLPLDNVTIKLGDSTLPQSPVEGGSWIAASVSNGIVTTVRRGPRRTAASGEADAEFAARRDDAWRGRACGRQAREQAGCVARRVDRRCDAAWRRGSHRAGEIHHLRG